MVYTRLQRQPGALCALALLTLAAGCDVGAFRPGVEEDLTLDESLALATQLGLSTLEIGRNPGEPASPAAGPEAGEVVTVTYDVSRPCLRGGSVRSFGSVKAQTELGPPRVAIADVTSTEVHDACVFPVGATEIAVSGDPHITSTVHAASRDHRAWGPQTVAVVGGFSWVADDGRSGRCDVDIWVSADDDAGVHTTRGTLCGHSFDVTVNEG